MKERCPEQVGKRPGRALVLWGRSEMSARRSLVPGTRGLTAQRVDASKGEGERLVASSDVAGQELELRGVEVLGRGASGSDTRRSACGLEGGGFRGCEAPSPVEVSRPAGLLSSSEVQGSSIRAAEVVDTGSRSGRSPGPRKGVLFGAPSFEGPEDRRSEDSELGGRGKLKRLAAHRARAGRLFWRQRGQASRREALEANGCTSGRARTVEGTPGERHERLSTRKSGAATRGAPGGATQPAEGSVRW